MKLISSGIRYLPSTSISEEDNRISMEWGLEGDISKVKAKKF